MEEAPFNLNKFEVNENIGCLILVLAIVIPCRE